LLKFQQQLHGRHPLTLSSMSPKDYSLSREEAAEALRVSVRTIDRYLRRHYFEHKRSGRQMWISRPSFEGFFEAQSREQESTKFLNQAAGRGDRAIATGPDLPVEVSESDLSEAPTPESEASTGRAEFTAHEHPYQHDLSPSQIYKTLYEEIKVQHDEQVKRLEGAHYRVGQLEAQVKSMVPMGEYKKQRKQLLLMNDQYKATVQEAQQKLLHAKKRVEGERLNKNVYISLVYALLALHVIFWGLLQ
jgi:excisionase family DNA binding protein